MVARFAELNDQFQFPAPVRAALLGSLGLGQASVNDSVYPTLDRTGASSVSATFQAAVDALPSSFGTELVVQPGTYLFDTPLTVAGKSVRIKGNGVTIVYTGTDAAIKVTGGMDTIYAVSAVAAGTQTVDGYTVPTVELTVTGTLPYTVGDVVKLVADDLIAGGRAATDPSKVERAGQHLVVHSVSAGKVVALGELYDPYTTNIRVAGFKKVAAEVVGVNITAPAATALTQKSRMLVFSELLYPVATDVTVGKCAGGGITFSGCYGGAARNCHVNQDSNDPNLSLFGYGISDSSSTNTQVVGGVVGFVRHGYTDNTSQISTGSALEGYGRTVGATITGLISYSTGGSSFDTHTLSRHASFHGCKSFNSGSAGFALRGHKHQVTDGYAYKPRDGLLIFSEGDSDSFGHTIDGLFIDSPRQYAVVSYLKNTALTLETRPSFIRNLEVVNAPAEAFYIRRATLKFRGVGVASVGAWTAGQALFRFGQADVTVDDLRADLTGITGAATGLGVIGFDSGATSTVRTREASVRFGSQATADRFDGYVIGTGTDAVQGSAEVDYWTAQKHFVPWATTSTNTFVNWKALSSPTAWSSRYIQISNTTNVASIAALGRQTEGLTTLSCNVQAAWTLPNIMNGRFMGQTVTIAHTNGAGTMTVTHGTAAGSITLKGGANLAMVLGDSIDIMWMGTLWRQVR